jgi:hypothetical protein
MAESLKYFMWGYQPHFQSAVEIDAKSLFTRLDPKFKPRVFLVGVLGEHREDRYPICIEPGDCGYEVESFSSVRELASEIWLKDPRSQLIHTLPRAQVKHDEDVRNRSLREAIETLVKRQAQSDEYITRCSMPVLVEGYWVSVVLQLNRDVYESHYSLKRVLDYGYVNSLIDGAIIEFLMACSRALQVPNPGDSFSPIERSTDEFLQLAGRALMWRIAARSENSEWGSGLFKAINNLSALRYERAESSGKLYLSRRDHPNVQIELALRKNVRLDNQRAARKLLALSQDPLALLSDCYTIYGIGTLTGTYDETSEDLFVVSFFENCTWELLHAGKPLMRVRFGCPSLPGLPLNREKFFDTIERIFLDLPEESKERLWELSLGCTRQAHGALIVISSAAEAEAQRLAPQCTVIEPLLLRSELVPTISAIDGAILSDPHGVCHAVGVILDGIVDSQGTPSRGSRYNSAVRYVETAKKQWGHDCIAVVVSEDGGADLIPNLRPRIRRSQLRGAIERLRALVEIEGVERKTFYPLADWLKKREFYLSSDDCKETNSMINELDLRIRSNAKVGELWVIHDDLVPSEEMNESFFELEEAS